MKPDKTAKGFSVPESDLTKKKKAAKDTTGTANQRLEAKLDYIIARLEENKNGN
jgi:hypothetical protein